MAENYYLGLDLSTQQLKCTLINEQHDIVLEEAVNFDKDLPEFGTVHGAVIDDNVVTSPTLMWVKALDFLLKRLKNSSYIGSIRGISGAGQVIYVYNTDTHFFNPPPPFFIIATR